MVVVDDRVTSLEVDGDGSRQRHHPHTPLDLALLGIVATPVASRNEMQEAVITQRHIPLQVWQTVEPLIFLQSIKRSHVRGDDVAMPPRTRTGHQKHSQWCHGRHIHQPPSTAECAIVETELHEVGGFGLNPFGRRQPVSRRIRFGNSIDHPIGTLAQPLQLVGWNHAANDGESRLHELLSLLLDGRLHYLPFGLRSSIRTVIRTPAAA